MKRTLAILVFAIAPSITIAQNRYLPPAGDPPLTRMSGDTGSSYQGGQNRTAPPQYEEGEWKESGPKPDATTTRSPGSDASSIGSGINSVFSGARNASDWWDASNLLDQVTDPRYEPDLTGEGAPEVPASLCGASAECNQCFARVFNGLDNMRINLEKLRVVGYATSEVVSKSYSVGDGLSGLTGVAALQWQHERAGIAKNFDKFKGTYDRKYEGMMTGLKDVMDRWDTCEEKYGERNWYARFGYLYYQFLRDKYKRNF